VDINDLRKKKAETEEIIVGTLFRIFEAFYQETGVSISDMNLFMSNITALGDREPHYILNNVTCTINL